MCGPAPGVCVCVSKLNNICAILLHAFIKYLSIGYTELQLAQSYHLTFTRYTIYMACSVQIGLGLSLKLKSLSNHRHHQKLFGGVKAQYLICWLTFGRGEGKKMYTFTNVLFILKGLTSETYLDI